MSKSNCMQKIYHRRYEIQVNMIFTDYSSSSSSFEILHVSRFPSDPVHRHIHFLLTLLLLEIMMIMSPDVRTIIIATLIVCACSYHCHVMGHVRARESACVVSFW